MSVEPGIFATFEMAPLEVLASRVGSIPLGYTATLLFTLTYALERLQQLYSESTVATCLRPAASDRSCVAAKKQVHPTRFYFVGMLAIWATLHLEQDVPVLYRCTPSPSKPPPFADQAFLTRANATLLLLGWAVGWQSRDKLVRERSEAGPEKRRGFHRSTPGGYDTGKSEASRTSPKKHRQPIPWSIPPQGFHVR